MKSIVILPTYNERENIKKIVPLVLRHPVSIRIVDDNSPDGTSSAVQELRAAYPSLFLLYREKKAGLGSAYVPGFSYALEHGYDNIIMMDADLSHPAENIQELLAHLSDFCIGSRYTRSGGIEGWSWYRYLLSKCANIYARTMLGIPVSDLTGGFNRVSAAVPAG